MAEQGRLVVVSNRVPHLTVPETAEERRSQTVGGLVSAVRAALEQRGGLWFGWSGSATARRTVTEPTVSTIGAFRLVTVDLTAEEANLFYSSFANRTLWPILHSFPSRVQLREEASRAYWRVNRRYAAMVFPLLREGDLVWVHDYHLFPFGRELRRLGWRGRIGFFLHTPFPPAEVFSILPAASQILEGLLDYDLAGVQTVRYRRNLLDSLVSELGGEVRGNVYVRGEGSMRIGVYPIGTDPASFERWAREAEPGRTGGFLERLLVRRSARRQRIVLGVDRLDYTKGIPERLLVFEKLLEDHPSLQGNVTMIQISAPSRSRVPDYVRERERVDQLVGRINGRFSEADWVPVHYLYRSYTQPELARFFREADVCLVTPLRDGMNLVAKEFVASQGADPGVLVLSKFCGAAETMQDALIVNPYDIEGMADALHHALSMPTRERRRRWEALVREVRTNTAQAWGESFLADLLGVDLPGTALAESSPGATSPVL